MQAENPPVSRRQFLGATAAGSLAAAGSLGAPAILRAKNPEEVVNLGIVGVGIRGKQLMSALGYVNPFTPVFEISKGRNVTTKPGTPDGKPSAAVNFIGVCDVFDGHKKYGMESADQGPSQGKVTGYRDYREMLDDKNIQGVIIATPDHWHTKIALDALDAGKDVYVEKCLTHTPEEAVALVDAVKERKAILQLGHQHRQDSNHKKARQVVKSGMLGKVHLVETYTNRNDGNGAWQYSVPRGAETIDNLDWDMWLGNAPKMPYDPKRMWQWRRFWDYGTGLCGDLLTHELDAVNMIMGLGIPHAATASGGVYIWKDGREVPDVMNVAFEWPDRDLTVSYHATLGSSYPRGKKFFGRDALMDLSNGVSVNADRRSERYAEKLREEEELRKQMAVQQAAQEKLMETTAATEQWTINKGMLYSFTPEGELVNTVWLHLMDWIDCINSRKRTLGNEDTAFDEAITAHMATAAYRAGTRVTWDPVNRRIVV